MPKKKNPIVLNLKELMGYLKRLQKCEESFDHSEMEINKDLSDENTIVLSKQICGRMHIN